MVNHKFSKEILFHFRCGECDNWWSYATTEGYTPKEFRCCHCGHNATCEQIRFDMKDYDEKLGR